MEDRVDEYGYKPWSLDSILERASELVETGDEKTASMLTQLHGMVDSVRRELARAVRYMPSKTDMRKWCNSYRDELCFNCGDVLCSRRLESRLSCILDKVGFTQGISHPDANEKIEFYWKDKNAAYADYMKGTDSVFAAGAYLLLAEKGIFIPTHVANNVGKAND